MGILNFLIKQSKDKELEIIYQKAEIYTERKINRICIILPCVFFGVNLVINIVADLDAGNPNSISNLIGITGFMIYNIIIFIILRKGYHHGIIKYITTTLMITVITIILYGYHFGYDWVHSIRSVSVTVYLLAIILSGLYQNPVLSIYAGVMATLQYSLLYAGAAVDGVIIYSSLETFKENILTWDILLSYMVFIIGAGVLMSLNSRRQQLLMMELRTSSNALQKQEEKAVYFEKHDELTGIANLKYFREHLDGQITKAEKREQIFAVMCIGIDTFYNVNQLHGNDTGDLLLQNVADRLKSSYRDGDFLCRFMGDKFLVYFSDLSSDYNVSDLILKTRRVFEQPFIIEKSSIKLSASAGICSFPHDAESVEDLISKAESAMYGAKNAGKNSFFLFNKLNQEELDQHIRIERELEDALLNNEFRLVYQPKTDTSGKIVGLESLLRWDNITLGQISPDIFIPIAEQSGMIVPIGYEIFRICCSQIKSWTEQGFEKARISVNVSPYQLRCENFVQNVKEIIDKAGIDPSWLGIEVTESGIMKNEEECISKLAEFRETVMKISIDDFGKGYSSLSRLGNYPLDTLKIDKAFVDDLPKSRVSCCLVRSIIDLAQNLNYSVIAEGVETLEQVVYLKENGCDRFQGYYFYRPLPPEDITTLFKTQQQP